ncbi:VWA domain-containing protein [Gilvimarinus japonicus]|uniref:VWA domain-containing protein n=1 Tax=Gilvimarinus japonicus TaxID=1796469 RepID=A0ABV7HTW0_9GAMM
MSLFGLHFLRPWLLLFIVVFGLLYWLSRRALGGRHRSNEVIAPHLVAALTPKQRMRDKLKPIDLVFGFSLLLAIAAAGPAWQRVASDANHKPPVVVVLKVSQSMLANDILPTRLDRAKQKIRDLLQYRAGAKTALIVYDVTSHKVLPMTEDNNVFLPFIEALNPDVMPSGAGDAVVSAIASAQRELEKTGGGAIVLAADGIEHAQVSALNKLANPFVWWQFATTKGGVIVTDDGSILSEPGGAVKTFSLDDSTAGRLQQVDVQKVTLNSQDLVEIDRAASERYREWQSADRDTPLREMTWYFVWPLVAFAVLWFRRGFISRDNQPKRRLPHGVTHLAVVGLLGTLAYSPASEAEVLDWFLSRDQQGMIAYNNKAYKKAAGLFDDPMWKGAALYAYGDYTHSAQIFATVGTTDGLYNRANALFKGHQYEAAIAGYKQVLQQQPDHSKAARNLALVEAVLQSLLDQGGNVDLEQSVTTDVDVKKVSEDAGAESQDYQVTDTLSEDAKDQWMRSVESDMSDFLTAKFATEAASGNTATTQSRTNGQSVGEAP